MTENSIKDPIKRKIYLQKKYYNRHRKKREKAIRIIGNSCKHCGISDTRVLQIDHVNPLNLGMRRLALNQLFSKIIRGEFDISNLQLLCANCHAVKTRKERIVIDPSLETKTTNKESLTVAEILWELVKDRDKVEKILRELFR